MKSIGKERHYYSTEDDKVIIEMLKRESGGITHRCKKIAYYTGLSENSIYQRYKYLVRNGIIEDLGIKYHRSPRRRRRESIIKRFLIFLIRALT